MVKSLKIDTVAARRGLRSIERRRHSKPIKFISVALPLSVYVLFGQKNRQSTIGGFLLSHTASQIMSRLWHCWALKALFLGSECFELHGQSCHPPKSHRDAAVYWF